MRAPSGRARSSSWRCTEALTPSRLVRRSAALPSRLQWLAGPHTSASAATARVTRSETDRCWDAVYASSDAVAADTGARCIPPSAVRTAMSAFAFEIDNTSRDDGVPGLTPSDSLVHACLVRLSSLRFAVLVHGVVRALIAVLRSTAIAPTRPQDLAVRTWHRHQRPCLCPQRAHSCSPAHVRE